MMGVRRRFGDLQIISATEKSANRRRGNSKQSKEGSRFLAARSAENNMIMKEKQMVQQKFVEGV